MKTSSFTPPPGSPPPPPRRPQRSPASTKADFYKGGPPREPYYSEATWRFQRAFVLFWLIPAPICLLLLIHKTTGHLSSIPVMWLVIGLLTSLGVTLFLAFLLWRCPECNRILFQTTGSSAPGLFFLGDPEFCPDCGASLRGQPPYGNAEKR